MKIKNERILDKYVYSKDLRDLLKFYLSFDNREELINYMKNRPKDKNIKIFVRGNQNSDTIVVIPTADIDGNLAKHAEEVYKDFKIIFVQSSGTYFNYSYSCNIGIKEALKYNPRWIILSNDDIIYVDTKKLKEELEKRDDNYVYTTKCNKIYIVKFEGLMLNFIYHLYIHLFYSIRNKEEYKFKHYRYILSKNYEVNYIDFRMRSILHRIFIYLSRNKKLLIYNGYFIIFGRKAIEKLMKEYNYVFDETFISDYEDLDLFLRLLNRNMVRNIDIDLKFEGGMTLGKTPNRMLRDLMNNIYFDYLVKSKYLYNVKDN